MRSECLKYISRRVVPGQLWLSVAAYLQATTCAKCVGVRAGRKTGSQSQVVEGLLFLFPTDGRWYHRRARKERAEGCAESKSVSYDERD